MVEWVKCADPDCVYRGRPHCHALDPMPARDALGSVRATPAPPRLIKTRARRLADAMRLALGDMRNGWPLEAARKLRMALDEFDAEEIEAQERITP